MKSTSFFARIKKKSTWAGPWPAGGECRLLFFGYPGPAACRLLFFAIRARRHVDFFFLSRAGPSWMSTSFFWLSGWALAGPRRLFLVHLGTHFRPILLRIAVHVFILEPISGPAQGPQQAGNATYFLGLRAGSWAHERDFFFLRSRARLVRDFFF